MANCCTIYPVKSRGSTEVGEWRAFSFPDRAFEREQERERARWRSKSFYHSRQNPRWFARVRISLYGRVSLARGAFPWYTRETEGIVCTSQSLRGNLATRRARKTARLYNHIAYVYVGGAIERTRQRNKKESFISLLEYFLNPIDSTYVIFIPQFFILLFSLLSRTFDVSRARDALSIWGEEQSVSAFLDTFVFTLHT